MEDGPIELFSIDLVYVTVDFFVPVKSLPRLLWDVEVIPGYCLILPLNNRYLRRSSMADEDIVAVPSSSSS